MIKNITLNIILCLVAMGLYAQKLPVTQLYQFKLTSSASGLYTVDNARWLTQFNQTGYNNQPTFINDNELYITVQYAWDTTQTDIYSLNLATNVLTQITNTPESEYSAKPIPNTSEFSVVRVDATAEKKQRLWRYPLNRSNMGKEVFRFQDDIGYYHWISGSRVVLFIVDKPNNRLAITDVGTESAVRFDFVPGRTFATLPNGNIACVEKSNDLEWYIRSLNPTTNNSEYIVKTQPDSEDFVVTDNGTLLMGKGGYLYQFRPTIDKDWVQIANLRSFGVKKIERMALNSKGDLVVVTK